jgi:hypothetical protein
MVLIGTADLENVHNELRFHIEQGALSWPLRTKYAAPNPIIGPVAPTDPLSCRRQEIYGTYFYWGTSMDMARPFQH